MRGRHPRWCSARWAAVAVIRRLQRGPAPTANVLAARVAHPGRVVADVCIIRRIQTDRARVFWVGAHRGVFWVGPGLLLPRRVLGGGRALSLCHQQISANFHGGVWGDYVTPGSYVAPGSNVQAAVCLRLGPAARLPPSFPPARMLRRVRADEKRCDCAASHQIRQGSTPPHRRPHA